MQTSALKHPPWSTRHLLSLPLPCQLPPEKADAVACKTYSCVLSSSRRQQNAAFRHRHKTQKWPTAHRHTKHTHRIWSLDFLVPTPSVCIVASWEDFAGFPLAAFPIAFPAAQPSSTGASALVCSSRVALLPRLFCVRKYRVCVPKK